MSNESKEMAAKARRNISSKQVGNLLLDNALYILMIIAVIVIQLSLIHI